MQSDTRKGGNATDGGHKSANKGGINDDKKATVGDDLQRKAVSRI